jgi:hypothetical protein
LIGFVYGGLFLGWAGLKYPMGTEKPRVLARYSSHPRKKNTSFNHFRFCNLALLVSDDCGNSNLNSCDFIKVMIDLPEYYLKDNPN